MHVIACPAAASSSRRCVSWRDIGFVGDGSEPKTRLWTRGANVSNLHGDSMMTPMKPQPLFWCQAVLARFRIMAIHAAQVFR